MASSKPAARPLTPDDIRDIVGDLDDGRVAELLETGASTAQLEEASAWAAGESDVMGALERPLAGVVARLYDILVEGEDDAEARRQQSL